MGCGGSKNNLAAVVPEEQPQTQKTVEELGGLPLSTPPPPSFPVRGTNSPEPSRRLMGPSLFGPRSPQSRSLRLKPASWRCWA